MAIGEVTLGGVIREAIEGALWGLGVAMPGRVRSYDRATQLAVVEPAVRRPVRSVDDEDEILFEDLPAVYNVPVVWPSGGASYFHADLAAGDYVLLVCSDVDFSGWRASGNVADPLDARTHHVSRSFAVPCARPRTTALPGSQVVVAAGGQTASAMIAEQFDLFLTQLKAQLTTAGPSTPLTAGSLSGFLDAAKTTPLPVSFASDFIKTGD